ncbi:MAG TPA: hypothetical protein VMA36_04830, partial [Candidatus Limnocylindria bacterium]|nr:hypothetical protein [Candidatus Limnocylindria bacterium]
MDTVLALLPWAALLCGLVGAASVVGATIVRVRRHDWAALVRSAACVALTGAVVLCWKFDLQTPSGSANGVFCVAAFLAACFLVGSAWKTLIPPRSFGIVVLVLVTFGGLLSPFAFLMSLLTIGDLDSPPMMDVEI